MNIRHSVDHASIIPMRLNVQFEEDEKNTRPRETKCALTLTAMSHRARSTRVTVTCVRECHCLLRHGCCCSLFLPGVARTPAGGFAKAPGMPPDLLHSFYSLSWLCIVGETGSLEEMDVALGISKRAAARLGRNRDVPPAFPAEDSRQGVDDQR